MSWVGKLGGVFSVSNIINVVYIMCLCAASFTLLHIPTKIATTQLHIVHSVAIIGWWIRGPISFILLLSLSIHEQ